MNKIKNQLSRLRSENRKLTTQFKTLKEQNDFSLQNSLGQLVQGAYAQANITSFNPILQNNIYAPLTINWTMLTYMYKTHGIIQTAIDMPVLDSLRGGLDIVSDQLGVDEIEDLNDDMEERGILEAITEATIWKRLYGGAALVINTDQDPSTPLSLKKVGKLELYACNRWELMSMWKPGDPQAEMNPWLWAADYNSEYVYFYGEKLHRSRIITMSGKAAPYIIKWQLQGWGMSEVERMVEDFNKYLKTNNVLYDLLQEAKIDVYKFEGLKTQLASLAGTNKTRERIDLMNQLKNFNNAIVLDKQDEFEQKQLTFSGLAEVMKENRIGIASALRMPQSKIFGLSASGFSSGEDDIENYNALVESEVRTPNRRTIKKILRLICAMKYGADIDIDFTYRPLRIIGSVEEETIKTSKSNRILALYDRRLVSSKEVGEYMQKEKMLPMEIEAAKGLLDEHPEGQALDETDEERDAKAGGDKPDEKDKKSEETENERPA